ncbi:MAG: hypothetical protein R2695_19455 [Acidimicrobiales bacterium]
MIVAKYQDGAAALNLADEDVFEAVPRPDVHHKESRYRERVELDRLLYLGKAKRSDVDGLVRVLLFERSRHLEPRSASGEAPCGQRYSASGLGLCVLASSIAQNTRAQYAQGQDAKDRRDARHDHNEQTHRFATAAAAVSEASELMGVSRTAGYAMEARGELPTYGTGARRVITAALLRILDGDDDPMGSTV